MAAPLALAGMIEETARLGLSVLQICDYPAIESQGTAELQGTRDFARDRGVTLELGTKGVSVERLRLYLRLAEELDAGLVRTMFVSADHHPTLFEAEYNLREVLPEFEAVGVTIAVETYEQVPTRAVMDIVERINSANLGICLDPGNVVAALENPRELIDLVAPRVVNLHIKDFAFTRKDDWVGFTFSGCPLGEGLLDYDYMVEKVRPRERDITQVIEQWLPWQGDPHTTARLEAEWVDNSIRFMKSRLA